MREGLNTVFCLFCIGGWQIYPRHMLEPSAYAIALRLLYQAYDQIDVYAGLAL